MPFINIRSEAEKPSTQKVTPISRKAVGKGQKFPDKPRCHDGKYEGTIGNQTKLNKF